MFSETIIISKSPQRDQPASLGGVKGDHKPGIIRASPARRNLKVNNF